MTGGFREPNHPIDVSPDNLQRVMDLCRRVLCAQDTFVVAPNDASADWVSDQESALTSPVVPDSVAVASLLVVDEPGRSWSADDRTMLDDFAAILAAEVRLRSERGVPRAPFGDLDGFLPKAAAPGLPPVAKSEAGQDGDALRILLADDLDLNRKLICDMLSLDGYICDSVADGAAAVEAVKCNSYDLVLMDMIMPGMDGMEATRAIRDLPSPLCDVPIVALTAHSFREQLDNCLRAGMNATLTKPMSFDTLSAAVNTWARHRQAA